MAEILPGNGLQTALASDLGAAATTLSIVGGDAAKWPTGGEYRAVLCQDPATGPWELVRVTGGQGTANLTVTRAVEPYNGDQTARAWTAGATVAAVITKDSLLAAGGGLSQATADSLYVNVTGDSMSAPLYTWGIHHTGGGGNWLPVGPTPTVGVWYFTADGLYTMNDATLDIGAPVSNRPRNLYLTGNISSAGWVEVFVQRTLAAAADSIVDIGSISASAGGLTARISAAMNYGGASVSKVFFFTSQYNMIGGTGAWYIVAPQSDTGDYSGEDFALDCNNGGGTSTALRLRRTGGSTAGTMEVVVEVLGASSFTPATTSGVATPVPTAYWPSSIVTQRRGNAYFSGNLLFSSDNTYDIGALSVNSPRDLFLTRYLRMRSGGRILGDFSNATVASRTLFQTNTFNSPTFLGVIANGTGDLSLIELYGGSDSNNSSMLQVGSDSAMAYISAGKTGTGGYRPLGISVNNAERVRFLTTGEISVKGPLIFGTDSTYDIGASGSGRPRDLFLAGTVNVPGLVTDAAGLHVRNGTTPQALYIYNTYTNASNYERFRIQWAANQVAIENQAAGTGQNRPLIYNSGPGVAFFTSGSAVRLQINSGTRWGVEGTDGHWIPDPHNTRDIGYSSQRPRDIYIGRNLDLSTSSRILGDFSNNTMASRTLFQASAANVPTYLGVIPNGTSVASGLLLYAASDPDNAVQAVITSTSSAMYVGATKSGTASYQPMIFQAGGADRMRIETNGRVSIGDGEMGTLDVHKGSGSGGRQLTNGATWQIGVFTGVVILCETIISSGAAAFVTSAGATVLMGQAGVTFSNTSGTAGKVNFYWDGGIPSLIVQNLSGQTVRIQAMTLQTRASQ